MTSKPSNIYLPTSYFFLEIRPSGHLAVGHLVSLATLGYKNLRILFLLTLNYMKLRLPQDCLRLD